MASTAGRWVTITTVLNAASRQSAQLFHFTLKLLVIFSDSQCMMTAINTVTAVTSKQSVTQNGVDPNSFSGPTQNIAWYK